MIPPEPAPEAEAAFAAFMALAFPWVAEGSPEWQRNWWPFLAGYRAAQKAANHA